MAAITMIYVSVMCVFGPIAIFVLSTVVVYFRTRERDQARAAANWKRLYDGNHARAEELTALVSVDTVALEGARQRLIADLEAANRQIAHLQRDLVVTREDRYPQPKSAKDPLFFCARCAICIVQRGKLASTRENDPLCTRCQTRMVPAVTVSPRTVLSRLRRGLLDREEGEPLPATNEASRGTRILDIEE